MQISINDELFKTFEQNTQETLFNKTLTESYVHNVIT